MIHFATPAAEVNIDVSLVRALLREQHPDLAELPLEIVDAGWDNSMARLGDALAVRLPRRQLGADCLENEQRWLHAIAGDLALPTPAPLRFGRPGCGYPWKWSIVPWLAGIAADLSPPPPNEASRLAAFFESLHRPCPAEAPRNPFRSVPLRDRAQTVEERMERLQRRTSVITTTVRSQWHEAVAAPIDVTPSWIHADLHPRNVLVADGALAGIIDWGDLACGDRATDLAAIWMLFSDPAVHASICETLQLSEATIARARGWAIFFGVTLLDTGLEDNPRHAKLGERILRAATVTSPDGR